MGGKQTLGLPMAREDGFETKTGSLETLMDYFLAREKMKVAQPTYEGRVTTLKKFWTFLRQRGLSQTAELSLELLEEYETKKVRYFRVPKPKRQNISLRTLKADTINLRVFLRYLYDEGYLLIDLCSFYKGINAGKSLPRPLSVAVIHKWFSLCDLDTPRGLRDRAIFEVTYGSGLRSGETVALKLQDIDLGEGQALIQRTKTYESRLVPLTRLSIHYLKEYLAKIRPWLPKCPKTENSLWLNGVGGAVSDGRIRERVRTHYRPKVTSEKPITLHALRHSCATHLLQRGASIRHIQELLGHRSINSTQVYTLVAISDLKAVHRKCHPRNVGVLPL